MRDSRFRRLVAARSLSMLGNGIAPIALAFGVLDATSEPWTLGVVVGARTAGLAVTMLFAGVIADHFDKVVVVIWACAVSAALQAGTAMLFATGVGSVWSLAALSFAAGAAASFTYPIMGSLIAANIEQSRRQQANAVLRTFATASAIGGAAVAGVLVAFAGPPVAVAIDAATFVAAALLFIGVDRPPARTGALSFRGAFVNLREGITFVRSQRWLWMSILFSSLMYATWQSALPILGPLIADASYSRSIWGYFQAAQLAGVFLTGLLLARSRRSTTLRSGVSLLALLSVQTVALALTLDSWAVLLSFALAGVSLEVFGVTWETALQNRVPSDVLSRVYAFDALFALVPVALGQVSISLLASTFEATDLLFVSSLVLLACAGLMLFAVRNSADSAPNPSLISTSTNT